MRPALLALLAVACTPPPKVLKQQLGEEAWREVLSPHVRLITDADAPVAYAWFAVMDVGARLLEHRLSALAPGGEPGPLTVLLVESCLRLDEVALLHEWSGRTRDLREEPMVVTCGDIGDRPLAVAMRGVARLQLARRLGPLPAWLEDGLARFHGATRIYEKEVATGYLLPEEEARLRAIRGRLKMAEIRKLSPVEYGAKEGAADLARLFVQIFATDQDELVRRLTLYLKALAADASDDEAWAAAFDDLLETAVDTRLAETEDAELATANMERRAAGPPPDPEVRRLSDGEALLWWAQVLHSREAASPELILQQIDAAEKAGGAHPVAVAHMRAVTSGEPPAAGGGALGLELRMRKLAPDPLAGLDGKPVAGVGALDAEARELARHASRPWELAILARHFALRGMPQVALGFAVRGLDADRGCVSCRDALALVLWQLGRKPEARRHQGRTLLSLVGVTDAMRARGQAYAK